MLSAQLLKLISNKVILVIVTTSHLRPTPTLEDVGANLPVLVYSRKLPHFPVSYEKKTNTCKFVYFDTICDV